MKICLSANLFPFPVHLLPLKIIYNSSRKSGMKKFLCLLLASWLAVGEAFETCDFDNWLEIETGYRYDRVRFEGRRQSPSVDHFKKHTTVDLWQVNVQDRLWYDDAFLQIFGGYGYAFHAADKAYNSVPLYETHDANFDVAQAYDNMGAPSIDITPGEVSIPKALSSTSSKAYSHKRHGYAWSFDISLGGSFDTCEGFSLEPRLGFSSEFLKIHRSFRTRLNGGYIALGLPFSICNIEVFPDIAYVYAGQRDERIGMWNATSGTEYLSMRHGRVNGVKASIAIAYELFCNFLVGFDWRFFHLRTTGGRRRSFGDGVFWKPHTNWTSNEFLGTVIYHF